MATMCLMTLATKNRCPPLERPISAIGSFCQVFHSVKTTTGESRVYFPNRTNIILSSLWKNAAGTALVCRHHIVLSLPIYADGHFPPKETVANEDGFYQQHDPRVQDAHCNHISLGFRLDSYRPIILNNPEKVQRFANIIKQENKRMNSQGGESLQMALLDKRDFSLK